MAFTANFVILTILLLHKHVTSNPVRITSTPNKLRIRRPESDGRRQCTVFSTYSISLPGGPELKPNFRCVTDDGRAKTIINVPEESYLEHFESGKMQVSFFASGMRQKELDFKSDIVPRHDIIGMTAGSDMLVKNNSSNSTSESPLSRNNDFSIAVIRVSDKHNSPDDTAAQISNNIFGTSGAPLNLVVGYQACSGNKIDFTPATGAGFSDGVMELQLTHNIAGLSSDDVEGYVTDELFENGFNASTYTNVMYIFPKEVNFVGAAAYGYVNWYLSVFSNREASKQYVLMHQIGHNFGHLNSGVEDISDYGDTTCMMGTQVRMTDMPRACFNAAKSWWFSWYSDRHTEVTPTSGSAILNMLSIDDYLNGQATSDDQYTIARIVGTNEDDLFVMYNRAEGINYQVAGHRNQVAIVRQDGHGSKSWLEAGIGFDDNVPSQWIKSNWDGTEKSLVIQICEKVAGTPDYARVIVYLQGVNDLSCASTCVSGMSEFKVGVRNNWGYKIAWQLKEQNSSALVFKGTKLPRTSLSYKKTCIDSSKCYKFKIIAKANDENCCGENDSGWYKVKVDKKNIKYSKFEGSRKRFEVTKVGECT